MEKMLPKGWVETELSNLASYVIGGDWGKDENNDQIDYSLVHCIRGSEIKNWNIDFGKTAVIRSLKNSSLLNRKLFKGDILLEISGGGPDQPVGRTVLIDDNVFDALTEHPIVCTNFLRLVRSFNQIDSNFLNNYLKYFYTSGEITKYQGGSNNLRNLKYKEFETIQIPLPPLAEQERIVAKLDKLFAQHEKIKAALDHIPQLLKNFRQQVLTHAVTGKLTEQWREGKNFDIDFKVIESYLKGFKRWKKIEDDSILSKSPKSWKTVKLGNVSYVSNGSTPSRNIDTYWNGTIPWIGSGAIQNNKIYQSKEFITEDGLKNSSTKVLPVGTVLLAMIGEGKTRAQSAIIKIDATINQNIASIEIAHGQILPDFLQYFLIKNYDFHRTIGNGTGPKALNCQKVKEFNFTLPPLQEQEEIVSRVESLFAKADAIEARYQTLKARIDSLPQALLHKAFKGKLVPQLSTDGDAKDLLTEIIKLKEEAKTKGKRVNK